MKSLKDRIDWVGRMAMRPGGFRISDVAHEQGVSIHTAFKVVRAARDIGVCVNTWQGPNSLWVHPSLIEELREVLRRESTARLIKSHKESRERRRAAKAAAFESITQRVVPAASTKPPRRIAVRSVFELGGRHV